MTNESLWANIGRITVVFSWSVELWLSFLLGIQLQTHLPPPSALNYLRQVWQNVNSRSQDLSHLSTQQWNPCWPLPFSLTLGFFLACDCIELKGKAVVSFWDTKEAPLVQPKKATNSTCHTHLCAHWSYKKLWIHFLIHLWKGPILHAGVHQSREARSSCLQRLFLADSPPNSVWVNVPYVML